MCFIKLRLQSFLERKSREAACFPSHGDWLNAASHGVVGAAVGKCTTTTPRCLKCVTSSLFGHNVLQSASSQFPCVPAQSAPSAVNKGARESERQHDCVCFLKIVSQWNIFSQWLLLFDIHAPERERELKTTKIGRKTWLKRDCSIQRQFWPDCAWQRKD